MKHKILKWQIRADSLSSPWVFCAHLRCSRSCLWTLRALITEEYFSSASGSPLSEMCRSPNGTTARCLLMHQRTLQNCIFNSLINCVWNSHIVSLIFCETAPPQKKSSGLTFLFYFFFLLHMCTCTVGGKRRLELSSQATDCPTFNYC